MLAQVHGMLALCFSHVSSENKMGELSRAAEDHCVGSFLHLLTCQICDKNSITMCLEKNGVFERQLLSCCTTSVCARSCIDMSTNINT